MIRVLSGGAVQTFVRPLASSFADDTVEVEFQPMGKLVKALADGYAADVVIVTEEVLARLKLKGTPVARVGVGVGVRESAPLPDLSTVEAFKRALLAAKSVIYMDPQIGTSGRHVAEVLQRLGISDEVNAKAKLGQGGQVAEAVASGEIELAIHQISEILPVKGVRFAGPLPSELQKFTIYVAARVLSSKAGGTAARFIEHLTSSAARSRLARTGYTSPQ
ncbi:MAG TPA: substrate-binding domain-containing protein [Burkholderiales bacterium]|jgi:molybdate transport system substrate-binding protein|nr:substrate-binding domain-containing protein [Burkholderiales bacterium]